jgi:hypothetical protein
LTAVPIREATAAGGPSSLSGKPRPETGVVLLEPVEASGRTISAELLCAASDGDGSVATQARFESAFELAKGNYYDVEARNREGDAAYIHVARLPSGKSLESVPNTFFTDTALGATGRFGSYSAPQINSVTSAKDLTGTTTKGGATRFVEVSFNALTQAGYEVPRRGVIAALQPTGSSDILMLVATVGAARWKKGGEADVRRASETFRVERNVPSKIQASVDNDYRYKSRSVKGFDTGESEIEAALARDLSTKSGELSGKFAAAASAGVAGYAPNF